MPRAKAKTCANHCRTCSRCFSSTAAFEKHRAGEHGGSGFDGRHCTDPANILTADGEPWFRSVVGDCRIAGAVPTIGIPIYGEAAAVERGASLRGAA